MKGPSNILISSHNTVNPQKIFKITTHRERLPKRSIMFKEI